MSDSDWAVCGASFQVDNPVEPLAVHKISAMKHKTPNPPASALGKLGGAARSFVSSRACSYSLFFQDDFKFTPKLTLNLWL